jgi:CubicO group peptidase (beta-lactamase class C family)
LGAVASPESSIIVFDDDPIAGSFAEGFEPVVDEFKRNFVKRGEAGASFSAFVDGRPAVDVWGGFADKATRRPWTRDTLQVVFSGTKGLVALCLAILIDRDELDVESPVANYWPEFAANGKDKIRVRAVASHTSGIPRITTDVSLDDILHDRRMAAYLEHECPCWPNRGGRVAYHALTYGWLCGELIRRVTGTSVGEFFAAEVAGPLGLETWIGLPEREEHRVSVLTLDSSFIPEPQALNQCGALVYTNPPFFRAPLIWNRPDCHRAEIPAAGGISTARSLAKLYGGLAQGGQIAEKQLLGEKTIDAVTTVSARGRDACTGEPRAFGIGFQLQTEMRELGPPDDAFGHCGAGMSIHGAWPSLNTGFSYCMNELRDDVEDERGRAVLEKLHNVVTRRSMAPAMAT